jgi:HTH-type transcriptional regulator / antitoxin HigA
MRNSTILFHILIKSEPVANHRPLGRTECHPVEAIDYYMDSRGLDSEDMEQYIGSSGRVSEILSRKRPLTLAMIRKLNTG